MYSVTLGVHLMSSVSPDYPDPVLCPQYFGQVMPMFTTLIITIESPFDTPLGPPSRCSSCQTTQYLIPLLCLHDLAFNSRCYRSQLEAWAYLEGLQIQTHKINQLINPLLI